MNATAAFAVAEQSQVAEPRRAALWLASRLDFPETDAGRVALVVTELATNLVKHARGGEVLLRPLTGTGGELTGLEILALDRGPGLSDPAASRRDGVSTAGTLGHGLGAVDRLAHSVDLYTHASGTVIAARIWREKPTAAGHPRLEVGGVHVSKPGEAVCGDAWAWRMREGRLALFIADGLGHGLPAHEAAEAAVRVFASSHEFTPGLLVAGVHAALRHTRGAAVAALAVDLERFIAQYAGLGNITALLLPPAGGRRSMVSHNGTAGHTAAKISEFTYPVPPQSVLVMFSDGLGTHWDLDPYPGLRQRSPSVIAGVLYRDFSRRRDDVTVVVVKERPPVAEKG